MKRFEDMTIDQDDMVIAFLDFFLKSKVYAVPTAMLCRVPYTPLFSFLVHAPHSIGKHMLTVSC